MGGDPAGRTGVAPADTAVAAPQRGFVLFLECITPQQEQAGAFMNDIKNQLMEVAKDFPSIEVLRGVPVPLGSVFEPKKTPGYGQSGLRPENQIVRDPLTDEDAGPDKRFRLVWAVTLKEAPVAAAVMAAVGKGARP